MRFLTVRFINRITTLKDPEDLAMGANSARVHPSHATHVGENGNQRTAEQLGILAAVHRNSRLYHRTNVHLNHQETLVSWTVC